MMTVHKLVVATALLGCITSVQAEEGPFSLSANVGLTTNYVFRGLTQTDKEPAIQGGFDINHESGLYAGIWGSNVDFLEEGIPASDRAHIETDLYIGFANELDMGLSYDASWVYYGYPGSASNLNYDFHELVLGLGYSIENVDLGLKFAWSPEFFGDVGNAFYYALNAGYTFPVGIGIHAHIGRSDFRDEKKAGKDYTDYGFGASYSAIGFDFSLDYTNTNIEDEFGSSVDGADDQVFLTIGRSF